MNEWHGMEWAGKVTDMAHIVMYEEKTYEKKRERVRRRETREAIQEGLTTHTCVTNRRILNISNVHVPS